MVATWTDPRTASQEAGRTVFGTTEFGGGANNAAIASATPDQLKRFKDLTASLQAKYTTPTMPLLEEPLHEWEKSGLTSLANPDGTGSGIMTGATDRLKALLDQINTPVTQEQIQGIANPYAEGLKQNLSKSAEALRAQITSGQGTRGARSFGDTSTGVQNASLNDSILAGQNTIDYNAFKDALAQKNTDRSLAATSGLSGINSLFGQGQATTEAARNAATDKVNAGSYVRDYNQNINDVLANDITAEQGDEMAKIKEFLAAMQGYTSSGGTAYVPGKTSTASTLGSMLSSVGW